MDEITKHTAIVVYLKTFDIMLGEYTPDVPDEIIKNTELLMKCMMHFARRMDEDRKLEIINEWLDIQTEPYNFPVKDLLAERIEYSMRFSKSYDLVEKLYELDIKNYLDVILT